jgi:hypothetical protein
MPFVKVDPEQEQREFENLLEDPDAKQAFEEFEREYAFRQKLASARKAKRHITRSTSATPPRLRSWQSLQGTHKRGGFGKLSAW